MSTRSFTILPPPLSPEEEEEALLRELTPLENLDVLEAAANEPPTIPAPPPF